MRNTVEAALVTSAAVVLVVAVSQVVDIEESFEILVRHLGG